MRRKIVFLLNPIAGGKDKSHVRQLIETWGNHSGVDFDIQVTNAEGEYGLLHRKITEEGITDIVIAGGDGTINSVVDALRNTGVRFGIIPMGSGNGLAFTAGIPKNPRKALELILHGKPALTDAFLINEKFSCMLSGIGFDAQVAHDFARREQRGLTTYVKQTCQNFLRAKPYHFEISAGQFSVKTEAFFISVANSNQFGNHFTIAPKASLNDGLLDIVIVPKMSKGRLLLSILRHIRSGNVDQLQHRGRKIVYFQASRLSIKNPDAAPLHIDGDPKLSSPSFDIAVIPDAFRLIRPQT